jgi:hypothetical protein
MSLGGKTTTSIDPDLKKAALENLEMTRRAGQLGFVPYKGATVAGFQPMQLAAMQNLNTGLDAFGMGASPMPTGEDLSSYPIYQEQLAMMAPGQRDFINSMFIDPMTGAAPTMQYGAQPAANQAAADQAAAAAMAQRGGRDGGYSPTMGGGRGTMSFDTIGSYMPGGVNTRNPGSLANRMAAAATSRPVGPTAPTGGRASKAPPSRSTGKRK